MDDYGKRQLNIFYPGADKIRTKQGLFAQEVATKAWNTPVSEEFNTELI